MVLLQYSNKTQRLAGKHEAAHSRSRFDFLVVKVQTPSRNVAVLRRLTFSFHRYPAFPRNAADTRHFSASLSEAPGRTPRSSSPRRAEGAPLRPPPRGRALHNPTRNPTAAPPRLPGPPPTSAGRHLPARPPQRPARGE